MRLNGLFKFMGVEVRPGFKDPTKMNYIVGLCQGMDTIRLYIEPGQYQNIMAEMQKPGSKLVPFSDVYAELDYNPAAQNVNYCMRLLEIESASEVKKV